MEILSYGALGIFGGIMSGFMGIGGAVFLIPILVYVFHFDQQKAQGTTTALMLPPIGLLAFMQYYKNGMVDLRAAGIICVGMLIGGYFGGYMATHLDPHIVKKIFGGALFLISLKIMFF
jgi:uncharacterized protein